MLISDLIGPDDEYCGQVSYDWCKAGHNLVHPDDDYWCQVSCDWRSTMLSSDWSAGAEVAEAAPEHSLLILRVGGDLGPGGHPSKVEIDCIVDIRWPTVTYSLFKLLILHEAGLMESHHGLIFKCISASRNQSLDN